MEWVWLARKAHKGACRHAYDSASCWRCRFPDPDATAAMATPQSMAPQVPYTPVLQRQYTCVWRCTREPRIDATAGAARRLGGACQRALELLAARAAAGEASVGRASGKSWATFSTCVGPLLAPAARMLSCDDPVKTWA